MLIKNKMLQINTLRITLSGFNDHITKFKKLGVPNNLGLPKIQINLVKG